MAAGMAEMRLQRLSAMAMLIAAALMAPVAVAQEAYRVASHAAWGGFADLV